MGRARRAHGGLAAAAVVLSACSAILDFGALEGTGNEAASFDGGVPDRDDGPLVAEDSGSVSPPTLDGGRADSLPEPELLPDATDEAGGPVNLLPSGDFESGVCSAWGGYQSSQARDTTARSGAASCRVCVDTGVTDFYSLDDNGITPIPVIPGTYRAEAWVRAAPGVPKPPTVLGAVRQAIRAPFQTIKNGQGTEIAIDDTWRRVEATVEVTSAGGALNVYLAANPVAGGGCFLVDDARLFRTQ